MRVDFNVPLENGAITDDKRIRETLPTINYLIEKGAKVILASHLGRPNGEVVEELRHTASAARLSELLGKPVVKANEAVGDAVKAQIADMQNGDVLLLENVRFYPGEEKMTQNLQSNSLSLLIFSLTMHLVLLTVRMLLQKVLHIIYQQYLACLWRKSLMY